MQSWYKLWAVLLPPIFPLFVAVGRVHRPPRQGTRRRGKIAIEIEYAPRSLWETVRQDSPLPLGEGQGVRAMQIDSNSERPHPNPLPKERGPMTTVQLIIEDR